MHNMVTIVDNTWKKTKLYKVGKNKMIRLVLMDALNSVVYSCGYWTFVLYIKHLRNYGVEHISHNSINTGTKSQPSKMSEYSRRERDIKQ